MQEVKVINQLQEDKQAFGLLVAKDPSPEEVCSYPLTTLPLALMILVVSSNKVRKSSSKIT